MGSQVFGCILPSGAHIGAATVLRSLAKGINCIKRSCPEGPHSPVVSPLVEKKPVQWWGASHVSKLSVLLTLNVIMKFVADRELRSEAQVCRPVVSTKRLRKKSPQSQEQKHCAFPSGSPRGPCI